MKVYTLFKDRELLFNAFRSEIFLIKEAKGEGLKIFTTKHMLQRLLALA